MRCNVVYIISNINKALAFEWIAEALDTDKFSLSFILLNPGDSALEQYLKRKGIRVTRINYHGKKDIPIALWKVMSTIRQTRAQVIHSHLFDASLIGLLAGKLLGISKRIYTRHHSTMHHEYFPQAVYYDRFINYMASDIVAISANVKKVLIDKEQVAPKKITLIHHGFRLNEFRQVSAERVEALVEKYTIKDHWPVIGVISRYFHLKGFQYIIPAFEQILAEYPNACLMLANSSGSYKPEVKKLLSSIPSAAYREIVFEEDVFALYQLFDVFVHTPINESVEAFGQIYVEALAAGVPSIFTMSGVAPEFIQDGQNAWVVPFKDSASIVTACKNILSDRDQSYLLTQRGQAAIEELFHLDSMIQKLSTLYTSNECKE